MNKLLLRSLVLIAAIVILKPPAFAGVKGTPTKYEVRLHTIKISTDGTDYITIFDGTSSALDIASVSGSNQLVGDFLSGLSLAALPDGIYNRLKVQVSTTFTIKGTAGTHTTNGTTGMASKPYCGSSHGGTPVDCTITVDSVDVPEQIYPLVPPLVVKDGVANRETTVYFDVTDALDQDTEPTGYMYPGVPVVTIDGNGQLD